MKTLAEIVSAFGAEAKAKLAIPTVNSGPEAQLANSLEQMVKAVALLAGMPDNTVHLHNETPVDGMQTRPDFAVTVHGALAGYIELKAPGKGFDP